MSEIISVNRIQIHIFCGCCGSQIEDPRIEQNDGPHVVVTAFCVKCSHRQDELYNFVDKFRLAGDEIVHENNENVDMYTSAPNGEDVEWLRRYVSGLHRAYEILRDYGYVSVDPVLTIGGSDG